MSYTEWDGQHLGADCLALALTTNPGSAGASEPIVLLAAASAPDRGYVIRPDRLGEFVCVHRDALLVCYNVGPVFWTLLDYFDRKPESDGNSKSQVAEILRQAARTHRLHDVRLLDQLVRLARGVTAPSPRSLVEIAGSVLGDAVPGQGLSNPSSQDDLARIADLTKGIYESLMDEVDQIAEEQEIDREDLERFGPLSLGLQVQGAIALHLASRNGLHLRKRPDPRDLGPLRGGLRGQFTPVAQRS